MNGFVVRILLVWMALLGLFLFAGIFLGQGVFTIYEDTAAIRLAEFIIYGCILGWSIYEAIRYWKGAK